MSADLLFSFGNALALLGWMGLWVLSPFWTDIDQWITGLVIALLAGCYLWLITQSLRPGDFESFSSLEGIMGLFTNKTAVAAGWIHYLAFDLFLGAWMKRNSLRYNLPHFLVLPCLFLTFLMGPVGLLLYLALRTVKTRRYLHANF